jgi:hypothetical protein
MCLGFNSRHYQISLGDAKPGYQGHARVRAAFLRQNWVLPGEAQHLSASAVADDEIQKDFALDV